MKYYELPVIAGTTEQQLEQIKNYLYLQNEALNYNLEQNTAEKVFEQARQAMIKAASPIESEQARSTYQAFRDLIIGTAEEAIKISDSYLRTLKQLEAYRSAFGTFTEEIERQIGTAPSGTTDIYSYIGTVKTTAENAGTAAGNAATAASNAQNTASGAATAAGNAASAAAAAQSTANGAATYITKQVNFIKSGYLDTTTNPPVFGIEIGMLESSYTETLNGQSTTIQATPEKIRITPGRISFITGSGNSETEAAYISNGAVYFPNAQITGGSIGIGAISGGHQPFEVDSNGNLRATGATISGAITATSGSFSGTITAASGSSIGGWTVGSNAIYRGSETFYDENTLYFGNSGLSIKNKFKVDSNGYLWAKNAHIESGSWIGLWYISGSYLYCQTTDGGTSTTNIPIIISSTGVYCPSGTFTAETIDAGKAADSNGKVRVNLVTRIDSSGNGKFNNVYTGSTSTNQNLRIDSSGNGMFNSVYTGSTSTNQVLRIDDSGNITGNSLTINTSYSITSTGVAKVKSINVNDLAEIGDNGYGRFQKVSTGTTSYRVRIDNDGTFYATSIYTERNNSGTLRIDGFGNGTFNNISAISLTIGNYGITSIGGATFSSLNAGSGTIQTSGDVDFGTLKHSGTEILSINAYTSGTKTINHDTWTSIYTLTLAKGKWLVGCGVNFALNAKGTRAIVLSTSSSLSGLGAEGSASSPACSDKGTTLNALKLIEVNSSTDYYLWVHQTCTSSLTVAGRIEVLRIG